MLLSKPKVDTDGTVQIGNANLVRLLTTIGLLCTEQHMAVRYEPRTDKPDSVMAMTQATMCHLLFRNLLQDYTDFVDSLFTEVYNELHTMH
jgi:hypothetical protein